MNAQNTVDDEPLMLDDVLGQIGIHKSGEPLDLIQLVDPFSSWLEQQEIPPSDHGFVGALVAAFICQYLILHRSAMRRIEGNKIIVGIPFVQGIVREFEPYALAGNVVRHSISLNQLLRDMANHESSGSHNAAPLA